MISHILTSNLQLQYRDMRTNWTINVSFLKWLSYSHNPNSVHETYTRVNISIGSEENRILLLYLEICKNDTSNFCSTITNYYHARTSKLHASWFQKQNAMDLRVKVVAVSICIQLTQPVWLIYSYCILKRKSELDPKRVYWTENQHKHSTLN